MDKLKNWLQNKLNLSLIVLVILIIGIFLRTYHFHDWLRFNADQGRDAEIVSSVVSGNQSWPLLGPKAGGTEFKLGPAFYYLQIVAAKIFGDYPDKMAYPDLLTGILCIPLLFLFLRKYFDQKISLALTTIFAVSVYAIRYSRFAWNPNSAPFWSLLALYAIHEVVCQKQQRKYAWALIAGFAIGIGVQLHTTLLLFLPITTSLVFGYFAIKNRQILKYFFVILTLALFFNVPQITHEYLHNGENVKAFFGGVQKKQEGNTLAEKLQRNASCWVQGSIDIASGWEISDTCSFKPRKNKNDLAVFVFGAFLIVGGLLLAIRDYKKEKDNEKKTFLMVLLVYLLVAFLIFVPIAYELSVRFYLVLIFFPFLILGFWFKFIWEKIKFQPLYLIILLSVCLIVSNLFFVKKYFTLLASYKTNGGTVDIVVLSQVEDFANFIVENSKGSNVETLDGNEKFLFKAYKPINYLVGKSGINLKVLGKKETVPSRYFYIARSNRREAFLKDTSISVKAYKTHGKFTILLIESK